MMEITGVILRKLCKEIKNEFIKAKLDSEEKAKE